MNLGVRPSKAENDRSGGPGGLSKVMNYFHRPVRILEDNVHGSRECLGDGSGLPLGCAGVEMVEEHFPALFQEAPFVKNDGLQLYGALHKIPVRGWEVLKLSFILQVPETALATLVLEQSAQRVAELANLLASRRCELLELPLHRPIELETLDQLHKVRPRHDLSRAPADIVALEVARVSAVLLGGLKNAAKKALAVVCSSDGHSKDVEGVVEASV